MSRAVIRARRRLSQMSKKLFVFALLLGTVAMAVAFDRVVVCEDAYAEY